MNAGNKASGTTYSGDGTPATSSLINGRDAYEIGLADYLVDKEEKIIEILSDIKQQVKKCAPNALALTKEIISGNSHVDTKRAAEYFSSCIVNEEGREGFNSFFEKRKPYWAMEE